MERHDDRGGHVVTATHGVLAVHYADRQALRSEVYYRHAVYGEPDGPMGMAYFFWVIEPPTGPPLIVDCGFDPELGARMGRPCSRTPADALADLGIDGADVAQVVVTHLHYDHIGNLGLFPNARFVVAQRELDFWTGPIARRSHFAEHTDPRAVTALAHAAEAGRVVAVDDELEVAEGITVMRVGGHSPGQLMVSVRAAEGGVLLASDAVHYLEELEMERPFAVLADLEQVYRAYDTVRELTAGGARLVPGHDPLVNDRFPALGDGRRAPAVRVA